MIEGAFGVMEEESIVVHCSAILNQICQYRYIIFPGMGRALPETPGSGATPLCSKTRKTNLNGTVFSVNVHLFARPSV